VLLTVRSGGTIARVARDPDLIRFVTARAVCGDHQVSRRCLHYERSSLVVECLLRTIPDPNAPTQRGRKLVLRDGTRRQMLWGSAF
jgi:hypothetical protein